MLKKDLRQIDIWALALGSIIGWGCFVMPGINFLPKAGAIGSMLGLFLGAVIICIISFSYSFMIRKFPVSGGEFIYVRETFGKGHSFVCGWMIVLAYWSLIPLNSTAIALVSRYIFPVLLPVERSPFMFGYLYTIAEWDVYLGEIILAWIFIIVIALINIYGVKSFGTFQTVVALLLVISVVFLVVGVLIKGVELSNLLPSDPSEPIVTVSGVFAVLAYTPYCFVGFDAIPQAAEEYNFPHKRSRRLVILAILAGGAIYMASVFVTAVVRPWQETVAAGYDWATGEMIGLSLGGIGIVFVGIAMFCAVISGINGFYLAGSRLIFSMAGDGVLPAGLGKLGKRDTPARAILFLCIISLIAPFFGRGVLTWIVDMTCVGAAMGFVYTCASAFKISRKEGITGQAVISFIGILVSLLFLVESFIPGMPGFLSIPSFVILFVWVAIGIIFYILNRKKS